MKPSARAWAPPAAASGAVEEGAVAGAGGTGAGAAVAGRGGAPAEPAGAGGGGRGALLRQSHQAGSERHQRT